MTIQILSERNLKFSGTIMKIQKYVNQDYERKKDLKNNPNYSNQAFRRLAESTRVGKYRYSIEYLGRHFSIIRENYNDLISQQKCMMYWVLSGNDTETHVKTFKEVIKWIKDLLFPDYKKHIETQKRLALRNKIGKETNIIKSFTKIGKLIDNIDIAISKQCYYPHKTIKQDYSLPLFKLRDIQTDLEIIQTMLSNNKKYKTLLRQLVNVTKIKELI